MINLKRLILENFLSHGHSDVTLTSYDGLTLISGINEDGRYDSNGSGKSTILEGIYYALTGNTLRKLSADGIVNRSVGKDCTVSLFFNIGPTEYNILRYRKHSRYNNAIYLYKDGKDISSRLPTDTQKTIDDILDTPPDILVGVMLMGEGLSSRFTSLSDPDKKRLLEQTVRLTHNIQLSDDQVSKEIKSLIAEVARLEGQISSYEASIKLNESLSGEDITKLREVRTSLESEKNIKSHSISEYDQTISGLQSKLNTVNAAYTQVVTLKRSLSTLQQRKDQASSTLDTTRSMSDPICPTCGQVVHESAKLLESLQSALDIAESELSKVRESLSRLPEESVLSDKIVALTNDVQSIRKSRDTSMSELTMINDNLVSIEGRIKTIETMSDQSESMKKSIASARSTLDEAKKRSSYLDYIHKKLFSSTGIITDILVSVVEFIDSRLRVYTDILMDKPMSLSMNQKGKISLDSVNGEYTYNSLSNGEKRRLDISIQFALHDYCYLHCGLGLDTLFIDEVLDTLDSVGVSNILHVLKLKMEFCHLSRLFVVTHNDDLKSYFDSVLTVSKGLDGITTIL